MQEHPSRGTPLSRHRAVAGKPGIYYRPLADGKGGTLPPAGPYAVGYRDSTGTSVGPVGTYDTIAEAQEARRDFLTAMDGGGRVVNSKITVAEAIDDYIDRQRVRPFSKSTANTYRIFGNKWVKPIIGKKRVTKVDRRDILRVINYAVAGGLGGSSVNGVRNLLSGIFKDAIADGIITVSPLARVRGEEWPSNKPAPVGFLQPEEIEDVLREAKKADDWFFYALLTAIYTGLRLSELRALRWQDIDLKAGTINVNGQIDLDGERVGKLKGKDEGVTRTVFIAKRLRVALAEWKLKSSGGQYVFTGPTGGAWDAGNVLKRFKTACRNGHVSERRWHDLRHTFASILINNGVDVLAVQKQMGHANPTITLNTYAHLWDKGDTAAVIQAAFDKAGLG